MSFIPEYEIERIKNSNDIVDVIGSFIKLTKRGRNWWALCPFHSEDTPSFSVSQDKQFYHCFGCGQGGDVISFVMNHEKMGYVEAIRFLAERAGISIAERESAGNYSVELKDKIYQANKIALKYFLRSLRSKEGMSAADYLKKRGISASALEEFGLGYAPDKSDGLIRFALKEGMKKKDLLSAGLAVSGDYGWRDFFRGRLMFPIRNLSGRVVAFGGRTLKAKEPSKYINTPESPIYHKGRQLFGLYLTKDFIRKTKQAIVVEGYTDLISLYSSGIKNVVCSSGTAFTSMQASLIARFADKVITLFDGDAAGFKAAERSVGELLSKGVESSICILPEGSDPDSFVRKEGADKLKIHLSKAVSYPEFKKSAIGGDFGKLSAKEKEKLIQEIGDTVGKINDPFREKIFLDEMERAFDFPFSNFITQRRFGRNDTSEDKAVERNRTNLEQEFLSLLSENKSRLEYAFEMVPVECFTDYGCRLVYSKMRDEFSSLGCIEMDKWVGADTDPLIIATLAAMENFLNRVNADEKVLDDYIKRLSGDYQRSLLRKLKTEIMEAERSGRMKEAETLQKRYVRILTGGQKSGR